MTTSPVAQTGLHLIAGCSLALLVEAGCGTALAHGGGGHNGGGNRFSNGSDHFGKGGDHIGKGGDHIGNFGHGHCLGCDAGGTHYTEATS